MRRRECDAWTVEPCIQATARDGSFFRLTPWAGPTKVGGPPRRCVCTMSTHTPGVRRPGDLLRRLADAGADGSFSNARRSQRFAAFAQLVDDLKEQLGRPVRIVDIGGTVSFWEQRGWAGSED